DAFVIAVNEAATNTVAHGDVVARVRLWPAARDTVIEAHDHGTWTPGPIPGPVGGMGLCAARLRASDLTVRMGGDGSTAIMRFPGRAGTWPFIPGPRAEHRARPLLLPAYRRARPRQPP